MPSIAHVVTASVFLDELNVALAPEEIATLTSLMARYGQVLLDIDVLNGRLQELLDIESPPKASLNQRFD